MHLDIWELLNNDKRVIVKSHKREGVIVTWDKDSATLELWHLSMGNKNSKIHVGWKKVTDRPCPFDFTFARAKQMASSWLSEFSPLEG